MDLLVHNRWTFLTNTKVGGGSTLHGANMTDMRLVVDTRTHGIFAFAQECASCNNTNRYSKHPDASVVPGLPSNHIRDIELLAGYTTNDTVCIIDNEGVG